jgi:hypothetical protein
VAATYYKVGAGSWTQGTSVTIAAPANHSNDAVHSVSFYSTDLGGNSGPVASCAVKVDTIGPTTLAKAAKGRKGAAITLKYRITDNLSPQATSVTLVVRNAKHKLVKSFKLSTRKIATWYAVTWKPNATGTYSYSVSAKDLAGNRQAKAGSARITVK